MTIQESQELRKKGYWILVNVNRTKVLKVSRDYKKITKDVPYGRLYAPLKKVVIKV